MGQTLAVTFLYKECFLLRSVDYFLNSDSPEQRHTQAFGELLSTVEPPSYLKWRPQQQRGWRFIHNTCTSVKGGGAGAFRLFNKIPATQPKGKMILKYAARGTSPALPLPLANYTGDCAMGPSHSPCRAAAPLTTSALSWAPLAQPVPAAARPSVVMQALQRPGRGRKELINPRASGTPPPLRKCPRAPVIEKY